MTNDQIKTVLRIWAHSGQIERHKSPLISSDVKTLLLGLIIGTLQAGFWALCLWLHFRE